MILEMLKRRKTLFIFLISLILLFSAYQRMNANIRLIDRIPEVFQEQHINFKYIYGMTFIQNEGDKTVTYPITDNGQTLYVLNGAGEDFKKYDINKENNEIVIYKNITSPKQRKKAYFQVVQIPANEYKPLVRNDKIKVRIRYMYLGQQSTLLEYDIAKRQTELISHTLVGK